MDRFKCIVVQIRNLNPKVALHSMLLALSLGMFADNLCKKSPSSIDMLRERVKGYIHMEKMSKFRNEVWQAKQKHDKREGGNKTDSHKSDKRHKPEKHQSLPKGPRYERYIPLTANRTTILEEAFNTKVPIKLPPLLPHRPRLEETKYCSYHHNYGHNTKDCWALKDKTKELI